MYGRVGYSREEEDTRKSLIKKDRKGHRCGDRSVTCVNLSVHRVSVSSAGVMRIQMGTVTVRSYFMGHRYRIYFLEQNAKHNPTLNKNVYVRHGCLFIRSYSYGVNESIWLFPYLLNIFREKTPVYWLPSQIQIILRALLQKLRNHADGVIFLKGMVFFLFESVSQTMIKPKTRNYIIGLQFCPKPGYVCV